MTDQKPPAGEVHVRRLHHHLARVRGAHHAALTDADGALAAAHAEQHAQTRQGATDGPGVGATPPPRSDGG